MCSVWSGRNLMATKGRRLLGSFSDGSMANALPQAIGAQFAQPGSALGMVKLEMEVTGLSDFQTDLKNPNFAKLAESIGIMSVRIEKPGGCFVRTEEGARAFGQYQTYLRFSRLAEAGQLPNTKVACS